MNKFVTLEQIARFNLTIVTSTGHRFTAKPTPDNMPQGYSLIDAQEKLCECIEGSLKFTLLNEAKYAKGPTFACKHPFFADVCVTIEKSLDAGEYLLTGDHPKVPFDKVARRIDRITVNSVALTQPKAGVISHAVQGDYVLATDYATAVFKENNDPVIGQEVSAKQAKDAAINTIWQQEGFLMATVLGVVKS